MRRKCCKPIFATRTSAAAAALNEAMLFDWEGSVGSAEWQLSRFSVLAQIIELQRGGGGAERLGGVAGMSAGGVLELAVADELSVPIVAPELQAAARRAPGSPSLVSSWFAGERAHGLTWSELATGTCPC